MDRLDALEQQSVYILRESYRHFSDLCMLWSMGKDSTVLLWLARKAFFGHVPFPLVHIDTGFEIPEALTYRDRLARELNLKFNPEGHEELHASLKRFHLATLGPYSTMSNLMFGQRDGTDIAIFEYEYPRGKNNTIRQTVIWMQRRGTRLTEFSLRPAGVWNQLGGWSGHGDIHFESHPDFSRDSLLRGDDESAIRELFTDEVLDFYEAHPELITEGEGNKLLFYREAVVVPPEGIRAFLEEALVVRSLFPPKV